MYTKHVIITLINGTWAENAAWTMDGSILRTELSHTLQRDWMTEVQYFRFQWPGENSHEGRRKASICLHKQLSDQLRRYPNAAHFLIAHSHGGNVALRTLRRSCYLRDRISGIICISTPFLRFEKAGLFLMLIPSAIAAAAKQSRSEFVNSLKWFPLGLVVFPLSYFFDWVGYVAFSEPISGWMLNTCKHLLANAMCQSSVFGRLELVSFGLFLLFLLLMGIFINIRTTLSERQDSLSRQRRNILRRYSYSQRNDDLPTPILGLSSVIDEALLALDGSWWLHLMSGLASKAVVLLVLTGILALYTLATVVAYAYTQHLFSPNALQSLGRFVLPIVIVMAPFWLIIPLVRLSTSISTRFSLGLGFDDKPANLLWKIRATRHAFWLQSYESMRYDIWTLLTDSRGLLFHSRIYSFRPALVSIANWIGDRRARTWAK